MEGRAISSAEAARTALAIAGTVLLVAGNALASGEGDGDELLAELGCAGCHPGLDVSASRAPDLGSAGLRFESPYVFDYLEHPAPVRRQIGAARMPDFDLGPEQNLSLALFLDGRRRPPPDGPALPPLPGRGARPLPADASSAAAVDLAEGAGCLQCHSHGERGGRVALDLANAAARLRPAWLRGYLTDPARHQPGVVMPPLFYRADRDGTRYVELAPGAGRSLQALMAALQVASAERRQELEASYTTARARHPAASARRGEAIFRAQNCAGCHPLDGIPARSDAPDLGFEGARVRADWLASYLRDPEPIRPSGAPPGSGARMPRFRLSEPELATLVASLMARGSERRASEDWNRPLSRFAAQKASRLLREKLSCLGCHELGGEGGRIGPDLSSLSRRLQPGFVRSFVADPKAWIPHSPMPVRRWTSESLDRVVRYLVQQREPRRKPAYMALTPPSPETSGPKGEPLYRTHCAACHGAGGGGDGFNAPFLPVAPTRHADPAAMSRRPDDTLFDGIFAGGAILARSPRMPAWGHTLSRSEIWGLVSAIRTLCACEGPSWSRDGADPGN